MRYDKTVYFQKVETQYNKETGDYEVTETTETKRQAAITQTGIKTIMMVYQQIPEESLTVRIQNHYMDDFDYIRIGDTQYKVDRRLDLPVRQVFVVSEVH
jgi:hypothetical protein